jgi:hypothetical protein
MNFLFKRIDKMERKTEERLNNSWKTKTKSDYIFGEEKKREKIGGRVKVDFFKVDTSF